MSRIYWIMGVTMVCGILADIDDILGIQCNVSAPDDVESSFFLRVRSKGISLIPGSALQTSPGWAVCVVAGCMLAPEDAAMDCRWGSLYSGWPRMPGLSQKSLPGSGALLPFLALCDGQPSIW